MSRAPTDPPRDDRLAALARLTTARVGLGRSGPGLPTRALLDFQRDHALARDAVNTPFRADAVARALADLHPIRVSSQAHTRSAHLQRPDLGRRLDPDDAGRLAPLRPTLAIVISDGLSAPAAHAHAAPLVRALADRLSDLGPAPVVIAPFGRVALGDEIGAALGARLVLVLIGERPGLSAPDSLGAYLTWAPAPGRTDSERNCVSNIRPPHGLGYAEAADAVAWLVRAALVRGETGVRLKDERGLVGLSYPHAADSPLLRPGGGD